LEARWGHLFGSLRWQAHYEPFDLNGWIPDFAIVGYRPELPVLVEIKPVFAFCRETANKMEQAARAGQLTNEMLLLGASPFVNEYGDLSIGWLGEPDDGKWWWEPSPVGIWKGSESENKNPHGIFGFTSMHGSYHDRITGCYDGGSYGSENITVDALEYAWKKAGNSCQWKRHA
jgi:hypothetical protein